MYKTLITLIIFLTFLATIVICVVQPKMHKTVFIFDSEYQISENKVEVETKTNLPSKSLTKPVKKIQKTQNTNMQKNVAKKINNKTVTTQKAVSPKKETVKSTVKKTVSTPKTVKNTQTVKTANKVQKAVSTPKQVKQTVSETEKIRQETILWNKWRSDIQNQIMTDTKLPLVPQGTVFKFSFDVDKFGKITNISTWSTNPTYTPYAIQYIAPVIRSYQGRSLLNFPAGSNRVATKVEGGWRISTTSKYSTSADYHDSERVNK